MSWKRQVKTSVLAGASLLLGVFLLVTLTCLSRSEAGGSRGDLYRGGASPCYRIDSFLCNAVVTNACGTQTCVQGIGTKVYCKDSLGNVKTETVGSGLTVPVCTQITGNGRNCSYDQTQKVLCSSTRPCKNDTNGDNDCTFDTVSGNYFCISVPTNPTTPVGIRATAVDGGACTAGP